MPDPLNHPQIKRASVDGSIRRYEHGQAPAISFYWYGGSTVAVSKRGNDIDAVRVGDRRSDTADEYQVLDGIERWVSENREESE